VFNVHLPIHAGNAAYTRDFKSQVIFDEPKKLKTFLGSRPTILMICLDNTLLIWFQIVLIKGINTTAVGSFLYMVMELPGLIQSLQNLLFGAGTAEEVVLKYTIVILI
jgi:hypothetical protein